MTPWEAALIDAFVESDVGSAYGLAPRDKRRLVERFQTITNMVQSGTSPVVHTLLARHILSVPPDVKGDVVECGVWKGASTASLSLVCAAAGRKLVACDSFQGLPDDQEQLHKGLHTGVYGYYKEGMFEGTLEEVRRNVSQFGAVDACTFVEGFFDQSLTQLRDPLVFAFLDVDLVQSTRDCLKHIWPLLVEGAYLYSDDAGDLEVVAVYFDEPWWRETLGCSAPGFVGSGCGLPLNPRHSSIGYTRKEPPFQESNWRRADFLHYPE